MPKGKIKTKRKGYHMMPDGSMMKDEMMPDRGMMMDEYDAGKKGKGRRRKRSRIRERDAKAK